MRVAQAESHEGPPYEVAKSPRRVDIPVGPEPDLEPFVFDRVYPYAGDFHRTVRVTDDATRVFFHTFTVTVNLSDPVSVRNTGIPSRDRTADR